MRNPRRKVGDLVWVPLRSRIMGYAIVKALGKRHGLFKLIFLHDGNEYMMRKNRFQRAIWTFHGPVRR